MKLQTQTKEKLWTKYFILIFVYALGTSSANNMLMTGLPLYALYLGGNNSISGMLFGFFMFMAILFRPYFGKVIDEKSRKIVLLVGAVIAATISLAYVFAYSVGLLLILRSMHGIGFSATTNASGTVVSDIVPKSRLAEGVGYYGLANTLSTAIGPGLSLFLINNYSFDIMFMVTAVIGIVSLVCGLLINYEKEAPKPKLIQQVKRKPLELIFEKTALPTALVTAFIYIGMGAILTFIPTYGLSLGIDDVGLYFTVYSIALLFTRIVGGRLADLYGANIVIIPGMIIMTISYVVLAYSTNLAGIVFSGAIFGLGLGSVEPTLNALMIRFCPPERRGAGNSTFFTAKDLGSGIGAVVWGYISMTAGFRTVFLLCGLSIMIALAAYHLTLQKQIKKHDEIQEEPLLVEASK